MRGLGIDCGFRTGFGALGGRKAPASGSYHLAGSSAEMGQAFASLVPIVNGLIVSQKPDFIVVAMPFIGQKVTPVQLIPIMAFPCRVQEIADEHSIPFYRIAESDARKALLGFVPGGSDAIKKAVVSGCRQRGWPCCDNHAGDALCVVDFKLNELDPKGAHERTPLFISAGLARAKQKKAITA